MEFSIFNVPLQRRIQTAFIFSYLLFILCCLIIWVFCIITPMMWLFYIPYVLFCIFIDKAPKKGGRAWNFIRKAKYWNFFASYFPASIEFVDNWNEKADKNEKYLFALHPHGIVSLGVWANVISNGGNLHDLLPNLNLRVVTLPLNFYIPIWREFILCLGLIDSHETSIVSSFKNNSSVGIVVGGAAEALDARPNQDIKLTLKNRRGFIRIAMKQGASLVPVFSFGENDLFHQANHTLLRKIQEYLKRFVGFSTPLFIGRGIFNYSFGLLPHRKEILTVFGKPIPLEQTDSPTKEQLNEIHDKYIKALKDLYDQYSEKYGDKERKLIIE